MHDEQLFGGTLEALRGHPEHAVILAQRRYKPRFHALQLEAQDVEYVRPGDGVLDAAEHRHAQLLDTPRQQGARPAHGDLGAELGEAPQVRPRHPGVEDVAHEADFGPLDAA